MSIRRALFIFPLLGSFLIFLTSPGMAQAQSSAIRPQTLSLTPFIFEERLEKGQTIQRQIELTNHSQESLRLSAAISDFSPGSGDGQPVFTPDLSPAEARYALSSWMKIIKLPQAVLPPGQKTFATIQISVPADAEEGSRWSGVLISYGGTDKNNSGTAIVKKAASLFFVRAGSANEQGSISSFSADKAVYSFANTNFLTTFADTGNVHLKPKGNIHIYNIWGQLVAAVPINRDAQIVLPQTTRHFFSAWRDAWAFGPYRAEADVYYGENKYEARSTTSFWVLPVKGILLFLLILAAAATLLWQGIKLYNARLLKSAGVGQKKTQRK